jgi:hypothetical protein
MLHPGEEKLRDLVIAVYLEKMLFWTTQRTLTFRAGLSR